MQTLDKNGKEKPSQGGPAQLNPCTDASIKSTSIPSTVHKEFLNSGFRDTKNEKKPQHFGKEVAGTVNSLSKN